MHKNFQLSFAVFKIYIMSDLTTQVTVKVAVILNGPSDWRLWLAVIRTAAKQYDIWKYMDPEVKEIEELTELTYPSIRSINDDKRSYSQLTEDEKAEHQRLTNEYNRQLTRYES